MRYSGSNSIKVGKFGRLLVAADSIGRRNTLRTLVLVAEEGQNVGGGCSQFALVIENETVKSKHVI